MSRIFPLIALALLASMAGCVQHRTSGGLALSAYDGVSQDYPDDGHALANQAADTLAQKFPPGGTTLALVQTDTYFGSDFEDALRNRGFAVSAPATPESPGIQVAYTLDIVQETVPSVCYLQVTTSDGLGFGTTRRLGAKSTRQAPAALDEPFHAQQSPPAAPEPYTLPDVAPLAPAPSPGQPQPSTGQTPAIPSTPPTPEPVPVPAVAPVLQQLPLVATPKVIPAETSVLASSIETVPATSSAATPPALVAQGSQSQSPYLHKEAPAPSPGQPQPATEQASAQPSALPAPEPVPVPVPVSAEPTETWGIEPGSLLTQLEEWTSRAQYKLIWKSKNDYEMSAASQFHCGFVEAVKQLFRGLHNSGHALRVTVYQGNHVLEVAED
jgi:hypothetical protein